MRLQVFEEQARSILSSNDSPDVPFRYSLNPYRGCQHACAYCYARSTHKYIDFGIGTDFDSKIVVKTNAAELLRRRFASRAWKGDWIALSGATDCYQPLEASYGLTRACLEACRDFGNSVGIITKSALVRRDIDVLVAIQRRATVRVHVSIPFADEATGRAIEPFASAPVTRFETIRQLAEAGLSVGVSLSPILPGLNDSHIPEILERARAAGATHAFTILARLTNEVREVFEERLRAAFPGRAAKVLSGLDDMGSRAERSAFGDRMRGRGPRWAAIDQMFRLHCRRLGIATVEERELAPLAPETTREARQGLLF